MVDDEIEKYKREDEIDLVDILAVLIKRKWTIIVLVVLSLIISMVYVKYFTHVSDKTSVSMLLPQQYNIRDKNQLSATTPNVSSYLNKLKSILNAMSLASIGDPEVESFTFSIEQKGLNITIQLEGSKKDIISAVSSMYDIYKNITIYVKEKNKTLFNIAQKGLENNLTQKKGILTNLSDLLSQKSINSLGNSSKDVITYIISILNTDIMNLERIEGYNKELMLNQGKLEIIGNKKMNGAKSFSKTIIDKEDLTKLDSYIHPSKSRKRQLLPVIVSVFLAFFIGIFLAFVIEFFSREDVKKRLKDASKR